MATFKRISDFESRQVNVKLQSGSATWKVGDLFTYTASSEVGAKITKKSEVETALGAGKQVYLIAQGDDVTFKNGTEYKTYKLSQNVAMSTTAKIVVAYPVTDVTNINGYEAE